MNKKHWSKEEEKFLRENYLEMSITSISNELDRSIESIRYKMIKLGLSKQEKTNWNLKNTFIRNPIGKERMSNKNLKNYTSNKDEMIPVKVDARTMIYVKKGEDKEEAIKKYLQTRGISSLLNIK